MELFVNQIGLRDTKWINNRLNTISLQTIDRIYHCPKIVLLGKFLNRKTDVKYVMIGNYRIVPIELHEDVKCIHEQLTEMGKNHCLTNARSIERQIKGMANTMHSEFIVMLQKS